MSAHNQMWNHAGISPVVSHADIACAGTDPEVFFPNSTGDKFTKEARKATRICNRCPHIAACLQWALDTGQDYGVWAGTTPAERRRMIRKAVA